MKLLTLIAFTLLYLSSVYAATESVAHIALTKMERAEE